MATYATFDDVAVELGRSASTLTNPEIAQWQAWLERVERSIRTGFKRRGFDLAQAILDGHTEIADLRDVEITAVARRVRSEDLLGLTSVTKSIDDVSITERRDGADLDTDMLELTTKEWERILPNASTLAGAFTISPYGAPDEL